MKVSQLDIPEVLVIEQRRFTDDRGFFSETYNRRAFMEAGVDAEFIQDNHSYSTTVGTVRGLHFQAPPFAQAKLVRVARGRIYDVAVDIRRGSPTFGKHVGAELTAERGEQIFVPEGFLHGFITMEPDTEVLYKVNSYYDKASEGAVRFDDRDLAIDWGMPTQNASLSQKDRAAPSFAELDSPFHYTG